MPLVRQLLAQLLVLADQPLALGRMRAPEHLEVARVLVRAVDDALAMPALERRQLGLGVLGARLQLLVLLAQQRHRLEARADLERARHIAAKSTVASAIFAHV